VAAAVLIALPVLIFGVPALLGHTVLPGDDLTQNFPLRALAGQQIRHGQLPVFNPYIWSGAPLLGDWNAAAAYPLTWLFAVLPAAGAWTAGMIVTWAVAGVGLLRFLRARRLGTTASLLGALSFAFAGAMSAQVPHLGLVAGLSWVPIQLLAVLRLSETRGLASRLRWTAALAAACGLTILAGEPRAIADAGVIVVIYAAWRLARLGRGCGVAAGSVAAGLLLGGCLGAVQWLPGLAVIGTSQRAVSTAALFNSGSLPHRWLLLMLVPDLLGGSGSFGQPAFLASYNLTEVSGYVGIFPLVAAAALLGRIRLRPRLPEWAVWHVLTLVGLILALGGNTPVGSLLVHLPLFGGQRLQSRNILVADLALAVLLAYWADSPLSERSQRVERRRDLETALAILPPLAVIAVVGLALAWGAGLLDWLRVRPGAIGLAGQVKPGLVPYLLIAVAAIAFVVFGRDLPPRRRSRWLGGLVAADLILFTLLAVVAVAPGLGRAHPAAAATPPAARPIAALGYPGRFAIYDPDQLHAPQLTVLGSPDLNALTATASIQGYSSTVDGHYAAATGSHQAMGGGQDVLDPRAVGNGTLDQLGTSVLLTPPAYLVTAAGKPGPDPGPDGAGQRDIAPGQRATWYFGQPLAVSRVEIPGRGARLPAGTRIGLRLASGATRWFPAIAARASRLAVSLPQPLTAVAAVAQAGAGPGGRAGGREGGEPSHLGPPSVTDASGHVSVANGQLQSALAPPRWGYAGHDGSFAVFVDSLARPPLSLQALPGRPASGASVRPLAGPATAPARAAVSSPHGVRVIRAVSAIPGWTAAWQPARGRAASLAVSRAGVVQAVDVPPGRGVLTWTYSPPGVTPGLALSLVAVAVTLVLAIGSRRLDPARGAPG